MSSRPKSKVVDIAVAMSSRSDQEWVRRHRPAWAAYLIKHGFEVKSFNQGVITEDRPEEYTGKKTIARATLARDGTVKCWPEDYAPTTAEAEAIAAENHAASKKMPHSVLVLLSEAQAKAQALEGEGAGTTAFIPKDETGKKAMMIHLRVEKGFDSKDYRPWTYWDDKKWRQMEPNFADYPEDRPLPLYGLEKLRPLTMKEAGTRPAQIMVHEGAKAARAVEKMLADPERRKAHPLAEELARYEHMAWIGGATNPHRTNFEPLRTKAKDREIVFVADRDSPGENAIPRISELLRLPMKMVRFDERFDEGFDFAEDWPEHKHWRKLIDGASVYKGPRLRDLIKPASFATDTVRTGKQGRPAYRIRQYFADEWVKSTKPEVFINVWRPNEMLTQSEFASEVAPFSRGKKVGALLSEVLSSKVSMIDYMPHMESGKISKDGKDIFNAYRGTDVLPIEGDIAPFLQFMTLLIPDEMERHELLRWIATLVARPDIRMHYAILLISETQGVGKTTLAEILAALVGMHNASFPSESMLVDSQFNSWLAFKRLIVVNEIYAGQSRKAYNRLKTAVTDPHVESNNKYEVTYTIENHAHLFACSNSKNAIGLTEEDRRWYIPEVTEIKQEVQYYIDFHEWLEARGLGIILRWALGFVKDPKNVVRKGEPAPRSKMKEEVVKANWYPDRELLHEFAQHVLELKKGHKVVLSVKDVCSSIAGRLRAGQRVAKEHQMRKWLVAEGFTEPKGKGRAKRFMLKGVQSTVVANFEIEEGAEARDLDGCHRKAEELWPL